MVPTATARASVAPDGPDKFTLNVSSGSTTVSPMMSTWMVWAVTPGEGEAHRTGDVVGARCRGAVGRREVHGHRRRRCLVHRHREHEVGVLAVALVHRQVRDREGRRVGGVEAPTATPLTFDVGRRRPDGAGVA